MAYQTDPALWRTATYPVNPAVQPAVQLMTLDVAVEVIRRAIAEFRTAPSPEAEPSYTPAEFGAKYGRSAKWARGLIARGELGSYQRVPGGRHTILAAHEAAWLEVTGW